jgi:hypothetical protein
MKCEDVVEFFSTSEHADALLMRTARQHADACTECMAAFAAQRALRAERQAPVPALPTRSFAHALDRAVRPRVETQSRRGFWLGTAVGGALAAGIAVAVALVWPSADTASLANPEVEIALNEVREVNMSLASTEALQGAQIHVVLTGAVGFSGYGAQRELRWLTDLDPGVNELTLPIVALDAGGGQVTVEVQHGAKRRTFVLDVRTRESPGTGAPDAA